jgi:hypothetical protein
MTHSREVDLGMDFNTSRDENPLVPVIAPLIQNVIKGKIGTYSVNCLVDSGATISCISQNILELTSPNVTCEQSTIENITGVGGAIHSVSGIVLLEFSIQDQIFSHKFHVIPALNYSVILGVDFLRENDAVIDFSCGTMVLNKNSESCSVNFMGLYSANVHSLARTVDQVVISPHSEIHFPVFLSHAHDGSTVIIEPDASLAQHTEVAGGRTLSTTVGNVGVFRLLNPSSAEIVIPRDTVVAQFSYIDAQCIFDNPTTSVSSVDIDATSTTDYVQLAKDIGIHMSDATLSVDQKQQLMEFLGRHRDVFAKDISELGKTDLHFHHIDTGNAPPVKCRPYRQSPHHKKVAEQLIQDFLDNDLIEESNSQYAAPIILVKKRDGSFRFVCDYRKLNSVTVPMSWPIPMIDDIVDSIAEAKATIFTTLDLANGFFQIPMSDESKHKTAFVTHQGLYQFKRLPQGLMNSPICFQHLMSKVLRKLLWKIALIYIDDIIVYSQSFSEHLHHLQQVFECLHKAHLTLNPSKCKFAAEKVLYLGHILTKDGVQVDDEKIEAVKSFPIPKSQKEVRSFLGLCNFYRKYVKDFAKIALPLNALLQDSNSAAQNSKKSKLQWTEDCNQAFESLKHAMSSTPVLLYPNFNKEFFLSTDASGSSIGFVLSQHDDNNQDHPVAYGGRALRGSELNWSITEKEGLALLEAIRSFRPYLANSKFTVFTDHLALKWFQTIKNATGRLARWSVELSSYNFEIIHKSGKSLGNADALSRRQYEVNINCGSQTPADLEPTIYTCTSGTQTDELIQSSQQSNQVKTKVSSKSSHSNHFSFQESIGFLEASTQTTQASSQTNQNVPTIHVVNQASSHSTYQTRSWSLTFEYEEDYTSYKPIDVVAAIHASDKTVSDDDLIEATFASRPNLHHLQRVCPDFSMIFDYKETDSLPDDEKLQKKILNDATQFEIENGILYRFVPQRHRGNHQQFIKQLAVPEVLRNDLMFAYHDSELGGCHHGKDRMRHHDTMRHHETKVLLAQYAC